MIVRELGDDALVDIQGAHAICEGRPVRTIRKHCPPAACDLRTKVLLYRESDLIRLVMPVPTRRRSLAA